MGAMCSYCGSNIDRDVEIIDGGWTLDPRGLVSFRGVPVAAASRAELLHTLAKEGGRPVTRDAILARLGSDAHGSNTVDVHVWRLRDTFRRLGVPDPIRTVPKCGYAWTPQPAIERQFA